MQNINVGLWIWLSVKSLLCKLEDPRLKPGTSIKIGCSGVCLQLQGWEVQAGRF